MQEKKAKMAPSLGVLGQEQDFCTCFHVQNFSFRASEEGNRKDCQKLDSLIDERQESSYLIVVNNTEAPSV
jgi:hypothetical protein